MDNRSVTMPDKQCKWYLVCPMKSYYNKGKLDKTWIDQYCRDDWKNCIRYQMEDNWEPHPDWMLPDGTIDETLRNVYP